MRNNKLLKYTILGMFTAILAVMLYMAPRAKAEKELIIYDVHTNSPRIVKDDGEIEFADYLRIRNVTDHSYDLTGLFLSDSSADYDKLPLDGVVIEPGDSVMIRLDPSWNFGLKSTNEENIYLCDNNGNILFLYKPSMKPDEPVISADSGFYDEEFRVSITGKGKYTIRYTLDGNEPNESSEEYTEPIRVYDRSQEPNSVVNTPNIIVNYLDSEYTVDGKTYPVEQPKEEPVDKAFILRAVAIDESGNKSDIVTREYFFCGNKYKNIMSIVADREDLFGDCGILSVGGEYDEWYLNGKEGEKPEANYKKKGRDWEIPVDMDYFRNNRIVLSQKCGMRLQGRTTRDRRIKNFQLRARSSYSGSDVFDYDFFDNEKYRSDAVTLDDSFKESLFYALVDREDIIKQKTTDRVALFINGELWNNIYIHQKIDEKYFEDHYGIPEENLIVLSESFPEMGAKTDEEFETLRGYYLDIDSFVENNDMSLDANYRKIQTMMDIDSYIDYLAINTWIGCNDWNEYENDMVWRVKDAEDALYRDGRFRWMLHDGDNVFNQDIMISYEAFQTEGPLFRNLMKNKSFRNRFADRLTELGNSTFSEDNIKNVLNSGKWDEPELSEIEEFLLDRDGTIEGVVDAIKLDWRLYE